MRPHLRVGVWRGPGDDVGVAGAAICMQGGHGSRPLHKLQDPDDRMTVVDTRFGVSIVATL